VSLLRFHARLTDLIISWILQKHNQLPLIWDELGVALARWILSLPLLVFVTNFR
jgi:ABC-type molybdate transport system permease subunit